MKHIIRTLFLMFFSLSAMFTHAEVFSHRVWDSLLRKHVTLVENGKASQVDYHGMQQDQDELKAYLETVSLVENDEFERWPNSDRLAFLINAYNAATVNLVLKKYPDLTSIKDLGNIFRSPWSKKYIEILGKKRSLDEIEHGLILGSGRYNDPRIHFAVNCASIGCPALRNEAYIGNKIEFQLEQQIDAFLMDTSRNYIRDNKLYISPIFKWYKSDFIGGWRNAKNLHEFLSLYSHALKLPSKQLSELRNGDLSIKYSDYDWKLNDVRN